MSFKNSLFIAILISLTTLSSFAEDKKKSPEPLSYTCIDALMGLITYDLTFIDNYVYLNSRDTYDEHRDKFHNVYFKQREGDEIYQFSFLVKRSELYVSGISPRKDRIGVIYNCKIKN